MDSSVLRKPVVVSIVNVSSLVSLPQRVVVVVVFPRDTRVKFRVE